MKYFGTDGIRGIYGVDIEPEISYKVGLALSKKYGKGKYIIGRDTRTSGKAIQNSLTNGIVDGGGDVVIVGILPTPAVPYLTRVLNGRCGIMVSASHNPPNYNGIKIFDKDGVKPIDSEEQDIESLIDAYIKLSKKKGQIKYLKSAKNRYIDYITKIVDTNFKNLKVSLDCAFGAASTVAKKAFERLGASVSSHNDKINGSKINQNCGSMYPKSLQDINKFDKSTVGFAFDGDADRLVVCIGQNIIDGDTILYNLSKVLDLKDSVVVATVLNNIGLQRQFEREGIRVIRTAVGDKNISELMVQKDYTLGGEQSGHYIIRPFASTGDGILAAMFFLKSIFCDKASNENKLNLRHIKLVPQKAISLEAPKEFVDDCGLNSLLQSWNQRIGSQGRIIVRMSGTEPKIRVMCEHENVEIVDQIIGEFDCYIKKNALKYF